MQEKNENELKKLLKLREMFLFISGRQLVKKRGWNFIFKLHVSILDNVWIDSMQ